MFKDLVYAGIGAAVVLKDKVEAEVKKLEEDGKLKTSDAKSFLESIEKKGRDEQEAFKKQIKAALHEVIDELGIATKEDIEKIRKDL